MNIDKLRKEAKEVMAWAVDSSHNGKLVKLSTAIEVMENMVADVHALAHRDSENEMNRLHSQLKAKDKENTELKELLTQGDGLLREVLRINEKTPAIKGYKLSLKIDNHLKK